MINGHTVGLVKCALGAVLMLVGMAANGSIQYQTQHNPTGLTEADIAPCNYLLSQRIDRYKDDKSLSNLDFALSSYPFNPLYDLNTSRHFLALELKAVALIEAGDADGMDKLFGSAFKGNEARDEITSRNTFACLLNIRIAQLTRPKAPIGRPATASMATKSEPSVATGLAPSAVAECTKLATDKQRESQTWPGDLASRSARLGDYQRELFLGRCAGHPQAKIYIANAEAMMAVATTSVSTTGVSDCLTPVRTSDVGRFENKCGFKINFAYCNAGKLSGDGKPAFSCGESGAVDSVGPNNFQGALISFAKITYFFACRAPLLPQTEYEPGRGIIGQCK